MKAVRVAALVLAVAAVSPAEAQPRRVGDDNRNPLPQSQQPLQPRQEKQFPLGVSWSAVSLNGRPYNGERPSFMIDQSLRARGFGGCNTFSATAYPLRQQTFAVGPFAITKKSCDKGLMEAERAFFIALRTAQKWDMAGATLVLQGPNGEIRLERSL